MQIFDLAGPVFIVLYWKALMVALLASKALRVICRWRHDQPRAVSRWASAGVGGIGSTDGAVRIAVLRRELGATELALISDEPSRVVEVALARLARDGKLRAAADGGGFEAVDADVHSGHVIEQQVLDAITAGRPSLREIWPTIQIPAAVRRRLESENLLVARDSSYRRCWATSSWPLLALAGIAVLKLMKGITLDMPVGFLILALVLTVMAIRAMRRKRPQGTPAAQKILRELEESRHALKLSAARSATQLSTADLGVAVALFGAGMLATGDLAWIAPLLTPVDGVGFGGGDGGGGGGGGDGGGGDGGGGSCGGCGGCGGGS
jgi:uncharacterized protein (TIGR04222 family)